MNPPLMALAYADVLMQPHYSEILPTETNTSTQLSPAIRLQMPLMSAAMDTVTESQMAISMAKAGGIGVIHKNMEPQRQAEEVLKVKEYDPQEEEGSSLDPHGRLLVGAAVGPAKNSQERVEALAKAGVDVLIVDTAHGHSEGVISLVSLIREEYPDVTVIGGNIATREAVEALAQAGAHGVKVGIGPGSICTTRIVTGIGVPQFSAVVECSQRARELGLSVIADGGIRYSGDISKALAGGADAVMLGSLLAGSDEAPGEVFHYDGKAYKSYRGMGSIAAMEKGGKERYAQAHVASEKLVPEGVEGAVDAKGSVEAILHQLNGGLRSSMGYLGAQDLEIMRQNVVFRQITSAAGLESHPHSLTMVHAAPNYQG